MPPEFSLQPVLDYRHSRVEALEVELGRLAAARQQKQAELEGLHAALARLFDDLRGRQAAGALDLSTIAQVRLNVKTGEKHIAAQQAALAALAQQIEDHRLKLVAARQDEETLVVLKNKELERCRVEQSRQENRLRDDIYIAQAYRRATSGSAGW